MNRHPAFRWDGFLCIGTESERDGKHFSFDSCFLTGVSIDASSTILARRAFTDFSTVMLSDKRDSIEAITHVLCIIFTNCEMFLSP